MNDNVLALFILIGVFGLMGWVLMFMEMSLRKLGEEMIKTYEQLVKESNLMIKLQDGLIKLLQNDYEFKTKPIDKP